MTKRDRVELAELFSTFCADMCIGKSCGECKCNIKDSNDCCMSVIQKMINDYAKFS